MRLSWTRRDLVVLDRKLNRKNRPSKKLFSTQWDDYFLIVPKKDDVTVTDRFDGYLINLSPQLQAKLLAFAHRSAVDDRVMCLWIERDG